MHSLLDKESFRTQDNFVVLCFVHSKTAFVLTKTLVNTKNLIEAQALQNNVLLVPGQAFMPNDEVTNTCRLSFSQETPERMDEAIRRLAEMIKREIVRTTQHTQETTH